MNKQHYYLFLDEGGNLDFAQTGTKYFTLTSVTTFRPFVGSDELISLKYDLLEEGLNLHYLHATEDRQAVRNRVFEVVGRHLENYRIDSIVVEKSKTPPELQLDTAFYPWILGRLLCDVITRIPAESFNELIVMTDLIPVQKKRKIIEKSIKETLSGELPNAIRYQLLHHPSMSCMGLQIADYCNWALYRKWINGDVRSYDLIGSAVKSEIDLFNNTSNNTST